MPAPFRIHAALEHKNVEPGRGNIWGVIKVEACGPSLEAERAPLAVALVVDVSGSMKGEPLDHALESCEIIGRLLSPGDQIAIVTFSTRAAVVCGLMAIDDEIQVQLRASLRGVRAESGTNLHEGLAVAAGVLQQAPSRLRRVMAVLSDGQPNRGLRSPAELAAYVRSLGIAVSSLGLGRNYDEDVLDAIATAGSGRYKQVTDPALACVDLAHAVLAQGGVVADHLTLRIRPAEGVEVIQLLPRSQVRFGGDGVATRIGDVFKDEARTFAVELGFDLRNNASGQLLQVTVEGSSPNGAEHTESAALELDVRAGDRIADLDAQREVLVLQADAARAEARSHADRRSTPAAVSILRQMLHRIDALQGFVRNDGSILAELREQLEDEAASYERRSTDMERSHQRKSALSYKPSLPPLQAAARQRAAIAARLVGIEGPVTGSTFKLWSENIIGRSAQCHISVNDASLSRTHARIQFMDDYFLVIDMGSTYGTSVNDRVVQSARLADGDRLEVGEAVFRFEVGSGQLGLP